MKCLNLYLGYYIFLQKTIARRDDAFLTGKMLSRGATGLF